jgi:hypothetical protein
MHYLSCFAVHIVRATFTIWACAASLLPIGVTAVLADSPADLRSQFLKEAPPAWKGYRALAEQLQGTVSTKVERKGKVTFDMKNEYKQNPRCRMIVSHLLNSEKREEAAFAVNPQYSFALKRTPSGVPWVMQSLRLQVDGLDTRVAIEIPDSKKLLATLTHPYLRDLADLVDQPSFKVLRAAPVQSRGMNLVQIDFDNTHQMKLDPKAFFPIQSGTLVLDPDRSWVLWSCEMLAKHPDGDVRIRVENEIANPTSNPPIPVRSTEWRDMAVAKQGQVLEVRSRHFDLTFPTHLPPDSDFTLTAFGLPEPPGITWKKPTPWYIWITVAGGGLLIAGISFRWLRRRYFTKPAAP